MRQETFEMVMVERQLRLRQQWLIDHAAEAAPLQQNARQAVVFTFLPRPSGPDDRKGTRIGGAPYWPADLPWPLCPRCREPLTFTGQFDCRHELIRPGLPGDVLTWHWCPCDGEPWSGDDLVDIDPDTLPPPPPGFVHSRNGFEFRWHSVVPGVDLRPADDLPVSKHSEGFLAGPWYGTPHVVTEWCPPDGVDVMELILQGPRELLDVMSLHATKLGGWPAGAQDAEPLTDEQGRPLRFLGQFSPIMAYGVPELEPVGGFQDERDWMWSDAGSLALYFDEGAGEVRFSADSA